MKCVECQSTNIIRYGISRSAKVTSQRYRCSNCGRLFQGKYRYKACKQDLTCQINKMTIQGMSVRQIAKKLEISPTTVQKVRKELAMSRELLSHGANGSDPRPYSNNINLSQFLSHIYSNRI